VPRRALLLTCLLVLLAPAVASAAPLSFPIYGGFHSVLACGEGESTSAQDLAAFSATGAPPASDTNQAPLYGGLEQAWPGFTAPDLNRYYRDSSLQAAPAPSTLSSLLGQLGQTVTGSPPPAEAPAPGVTIMRSTPYGCHGSTAIRARRRCGARAT